VRFLEVGFHVPTGFLQERAHDLVDLTRTMDTLKAKEYELEMYVSNHQKNRVNRQGQEQEVGLTQEG
jgi:hypothetical protein